MSCATFTKAIRSLIPGVFQENINCTVVDLIDVGAVNTSVGLESEAVVNSDSMLAVDVPNIVTDTAPPRQIKCETATCAATSNAKAPHQMRTDMVGHGVISYGSGR